jgi:hypothetical protein
VWVFICLFFLLPLGVFSGAKEKFRGEQDEDNVHYNH